MSKINDVARRFDYWMKNYDHRDETVSESFKSFIVEDRCIVEYGISYDEYQQLSEKLEGMGYSIEWIVPQDTYAFLVEESQKRIMKR